MRKYSKLFKRVQAMILVVAMLLSTMNLGLFLTVSAVGSTGEVDKTDGEIVADNYGLTEEEKTLLKSGYLVGSVHDYNTPASDSLISVDIDDKTITAKTYNGRQSGKGYVWVPKTADIVVGNDVKESIALTDGKGGYTYAGSTFSVKVNYELRIDVDVDLQADLLNAPLWLKQGTVNMETIFGVGMNNFGAIAGAMDTFQSLCNGIIIPIGGFTANLQFDAPAREATEKLKQQMKDNGGVLTLTAMAAEYAVANSKVEYLLEHPELLDVLRETYECVLTISEDDLLSNKLFDQYLQSSDPAAFTRFQAFKNMMGEWLYDLEPVYNDPWTILDKDVVRDDLTADEYKKLDGLVDALKSVETKGQKQEVTGSSLLADTAVVQFNMNMYNVTVKVVYKTANDTPGVLELVEADVKDIIVLTFAENATKQEILANPDLCDAVEEWEKQTGYAAEHYIVSGTGLSDALTGDVTYTITYSPKYYTLNNLAVTSQVPYGYKMILEKHADGTMAYDYKVNGVDKAQGQEIAITGDTTITRAVGKSYVSSNLSQVVADWYFEVVEKDDTAAAILTSGALTVGNDTINVRYPDNDGDIVTLEDNKLTAKSYPASYNGLSWVPYTYTVSKDGNSTTYKFNGNQTVTIESGYSGVSVKYCLKLTNLAAGDVTYVKDLPGVLVEDAKTQVETLNRLSNYTDTIGQLDRTKLGALNGVIGVTTLHDNPQKNKELQTYFSGIVNNIITDCVPSTGSQLRIYGLLLAYESEGLAYYYRNSKTFINEINTLSGYLSDMLADDEKVAALEKLVDAAGFPEYADKIKDLESVMADVKASLTAPNAAINLESAQFNKLVAVLESAVKNDTVISNPAYGDGLYIVTDGSFEFVADGIKTITIKVNVAGKKPVTVSFNYSEEDVLNAADVQTLIQAVESALAAIPGFDADYYTVAENYKSVLNALKGKKVGDLAKYTYAFNYETKKVIVHVEGMDFDQTIDIDNLVINLTMSPTAEYRYDYMINGAAYSYATYDFGKNLSAAQIKALLNSGTLTIERNEVHIAGERLTAMVNQMNEAVGNDVITFLLVKNGAKYSIVMKINASDDAAAVPAALQSAIMSLALDSGYSYIGMDGNAVIYLNEESSLTISLQAAIDAITYSGFGSQTLIDMMDSNGNINHMKLPGEVVSDKKVGKLGGEMITTTMELGDTAQNAMTLPFYITMGSVSTPMLQARNLFDQQLGNYFAFVMEDGKSSLHMTMPELAYEAYLAALLITGNVDIEDINSVNAEISAGFIEGFTDPIFAEGSSLTTLNNTMNIFGFNVDLLGYDELYSKMCEQYANTTITYDKTAGEMTRYIPIKELIGSVDGAGDFAQMIKEYETGVSITARASLTNLGIKYEALYVDVKAENVTHKLGLTSDLKAKVDELSGVSVVVLMSDFEGDLAFDQTTVLNLNGFVIDGDVSSKGQLTIVDTSLNRENMGGVTGNVSGNVMITGGRYNKNVSKFIRSGYEQRPDGEVCNSFYSFVKDNEGNLTIELDAGMFLLYIEEGPSVMPMLVDLVFDMLFNGYTTNSLEIAGSKIYDISVRDFVGLYTGDNRLEWLADQILNLVDPIALGSLTTKLFGDLIDFHNIENALRNDEPIVSYDMVTGSWNVALEHVEKNDYFTTSIVSGNIENRKLMIKFSGSDADKKRLADAFGIINDTTDVDISVSLNPIFNTTQKDLGLEYNMYTSVVIDLSKDRSFAVVFSILAADSITGAKREALIAGIKNYYETRNITQLRKAFNALTSGEVVAAVKGLGRDDQFSTMVARLELGEFIADDLVALEDVFDNYAKVVAAILRRTGFDGGNKTLASIYDGKYGIDRENLNQGIDRELFKGYNIVFNISIDRMNFQIDLFGDESIIDELNYDALQAQIDRAQALTKKDYTTASWNVMTDALNAAKALMGNAQTQNQIAKATDALKNAIDNLEKLDYTELQELVDTAKSKNENLYTMDSWTRLENALAAAELMLSEGADAQADVDAMAQTLKGAIDGLEEKPGDPTLDYDALKEAIKKAEALTESDYIEDTWAVLEKALAEAKVVVDNAKTQDEIDAATQKLNSAINGLEKKPMDYEALKQAIAEAETKKERDYSATSFVKLTNALKKAKALLPNKAETQSEIDKATQALESAIRSLVKLDYSELEAQIAKANALDEGAYTKVTWANLVTALNYAVAVNENAGTQNEINTAASNLEGAIAALKLIPNYEALIDLIQSIRNEIKAGTLNESDYTEASWQALEDALDAATALIGNAEDQDEVNAAWNNLDNAYKSLVKKATAVDYAALQEQIDRAEALTETDYTAASWATMKQAWDEAVVWMANDKATQQEINDATQKLKNAIDELVRIKELNDLIDDAEALNEDDYTEASWQALEDALDAAKNVRDTATTQTEVDNAIAALQKAIDELVEKSAGPNFDALDALIDSAKTLNEDDYTVKSWNALIAQLSEAENVRATATTQTEVDAAAAALQKAIDELVYIKDLNDLIAKAKALNEDEYTEESWAAMLVQLNAAEAVAKNENATKDEVAQATTALDNAIKGLKEKLDYSELRKLISYADSLNQDHYLAATWNAMLIPLNAAKALEKNKAETQDEINAATEVLKDAIDALVYIKRLDDLIAKAEAILADGEYAGYHYTQATIDQLKSVYDAVMQQYASATTQDKVDELADTLKKAIDALDILAAPTLGSVTAGTHTQLRGETIITNDRMILNVKATGITVKDYLTLLNFDIEGEDLTINITVDGVDLADIDENALIYTGATVNVHARNKAGEVDITYTVVVMGDNNGSGHIDFLDLIQLCEHLGGVDELIGIYAEAADIRADGDFDIRDLIRLCEVVGEQ